MPTSDILPLTDAYRSVRRLTTPEAPLPGLLARAGDDAVHLVDADGLGEWAGLRDHGPHVLSPHDIARTESGHALVLPWCVEPLDAFLQRRVRGGVLLEAGEAVTLGVSVLRGLAALTPRAHVDEPARGRWWLTDDGCPMFCVRVESLGAPRSGDDAVVTASGALIELASGACADARVAGALRRVANSLAQGVRDLAAREAEVFALAAPTPLVLAPLTPLRAVGLGRDAAVGIDVHPDAAPVDRASGRLAGLVRGMVHRHVDTDVADLVSDAVSGARTGAQRLRGVLRRPWLAAAVVAGAIVVVGLAWPDGSEPALARGETVDIIEPSPTPSVANASAPIAPEAARPSPDAAAVEESPSAASPGIDLVSELESLLDRRARCIESGESGCLGEIVEDISAELPAGPIDLPAGARVVTLLDDLGGAAVFSVEAQAGSDEGPTQLVVAVRGEGGWVIRDARNVAAPE